MSEIFGITDEEIDAQKIIERIRENIKKRKSEPSQDMRPQGTQAGDSHQFLNLDIDKEMRRDITLANQKYNTSDLLMISRFGKIAGILKKLVNRSIRFYTMRQAEFNGAIVRLLNKFVEKITNLNSYLKDLGTRISELETETKKRHEELEKSVEEKTGAITREVSDQGSELSQRVGDISKRIDSLGAEVQGRVEVLRIQGLEVQKRHEELDRRLEERVEALSREVNHQGGELSQRIEDTARGIDSLGAEVQERFEALRAQGLEVQKRHEELEKRLEEKADAVSQEFNWLDSRLAQELLTHKQELARQTGPLMGMSDRLATLATKMHELKTNVIFQERRLTMLLEEARRRLPKLFREDQLAVFAKELEQMNDLMYVQFEDQFRGTREDIRERVKIYLPIMRESKAGTEKRPILDLGCGRGEWLEVLREEGLKARGIDLNKAVVEMVQEMGLEVTQAEVLDYLQSLPDKSLGAVTGFHIMEHLPLRILLRVLEETVRVLKVGGVAVFETPNPKNILVGACDFYIDPTHRNPIPPDTLRFLAEARGLVRVDIIYLRPDGEENRLGPGGHPELTETLNALLYGPTDYAVVGYKA